MSFETDFDSAFTILLGKAAGVITTTGTTTGSGTSTGTGTTVAITAGIEFIIDGGGTVISAGNAGGLVVPLTGVITRVELQEFDGITGSITVDIARGSPGNNPTFTSITGSTTPRITTGRHYVDEVLSGWTTSLSNGDALRYTASSVTSITRVTVVLFVRRTDIIGLSA